MEETWVRVIEGTLQIPWETEEEYLQRESAVRELGSRIELVSKYDCVRALQIFEALAIASKKIEKRLKRKRLSGTERLELELQSYDLGDLALRVSSHLVPELNE